MWLFALFRGFCFAKITNNYLIIKELFASESALIEVYNNKKAPSKYMKGLSYIIFLKIIQLQLQKGFLHQYLYKVQLYKYNFQVL